MEAIKAIIVLLSALVGAVLDPRFGPFMGTYWFGWLEGGTDTPFGVFVCTPIGAGPDLWLGGVLAVRWLKRLPDE